MVHKFVIIIRCLFTVSALQNDFYNITFQLNLCNIIFNKICNDQYFAWTTQLLFIAIKLVEQVPNHYKNSYLQSS